jgi:hypothetical protein
MDDIRNDFQSFGYKEDISGTSINAQIQDLNMYSIWILIYIQYYTTLKMFNVILYNIFDMSQNYFFTT